MGVAATMVQLPAVPLAVKVGVVAWPSDLVVMTQALDVVLAERAPTRRMVGPGRLSHGADNVMAGQP